jgi:hypothetical protein
MKNIIFIDWDDTLFPTTWVNKNKINCLDKNDVNKYKLIFLELDKSISNLLETITKNNDNFVYIVSNANKKWIEMALTPLPITSSIINKTSLNTTNNNTTNNNTTNNNTTNNNTTNNNDIVIISAKDKYNEKYSSPIDWKILTFKDIINDVYKINTNGASDASGPSGDYAYIKSTSNEFKESKGIGSKFCGSIVSIGDAQYEYTALVKLYDYFKNIGYTIHQRSLRDQMSLWDQSSIHTVLDDNISEYKKALVHRGKGEYLLKSIKFIDKPEFDVLINQLHELNQHIINIINIREVVDVTFAD